MFIITECGPDETFWAWGYLCISIYFFLLGLCIAWQTNNTKCKQPSQINIISNVKLKLPKKRKEMEMFKPLNGSKLHHLEGLYVCVLNQWKLSVIKKVIVPIINCGRASAVLEK